MKDLREEINIIAGQLVGHGFNDKAFGLIEPTKECEVFFKLKVDKLLSLFKQQMKEERKELINLIRSLDEPKEAKSLFGGAYSYFMDGCIAVKKQILKNIEE